MSSVSRKEFYTDYLKAFDDGNAALFVGAGLSRGAGFSTWSEFLADIAEEIGLDVKKEHDLLSLAQYHVNERGEDKIRRRILEEFTKEATVTPNHRLIAQLPLRTIWTTNYDSLIEDALRAAGRRADVKIRPDSLRSPKPDSDVVLYKMHGDADPNHAREAVLLKDDYIGYLNKRQLFADALQVDLVSKRFLFLGFSFDDPNIEYFLGRIWNLLDRKSSTHYCVMRRPEKPARLRGEAKAHYEYECRKFELRRNDLKHRYGILTIEIDNWPEITDILRELQSRSRRKDVFVSGSAHDFTPLSRQRVEAFAEKLGRELIQRGYHLVSGVGLGIGGAVTLGALQELYGSSQSGLSERMMMRPFPQDVPAAQRKELYTRHRREMISNVGFTIFLGGNKAERDATGTVLKDPNGNDRIVIADGVEEEWALTKELGKVPIPIGATGFVAEQIWNEVMVAPQQFYRGKDVRKHLRILNDSAKGDKEWIDAVFAIIEAVSE